MIKPALYFLLLLTMFGCGGSGESIRFAYQDRVGDAAAIVAADELREDSRFRLYRFSSGALTAEALISGSADVATMGAAAAVALAARYPEMVVLLGVHGSGPSRHKLVSPVPRPGVIGVKFGTSTHAALQAWLHYPARLVDLPPDMQLAALAAGEVEALAASEPTPLLALARIPGLASYSLEVPGRVYPLVLVASRRVLEDKPSLVNALVGRIAAAGDALIQPLSPATRQLLESVTGLKGDLLVSSLESHHYGFSPIAGHRSELEELAEFLTAQGKVPAPPGPGIYEGFAFTGD